MSNQYNKETIDIVILWVDGNDVHWREKKEEYRNQERMNVDSNDVRYRDYGILKYLFRGIEEFAPWVNKVFLVTNGQIPSWLNNSAEQLVLVKHEDFIPEEFLPTFSANPIELALHRIESLSEKFIYFNDDMFLLSPVSPSHFYLNGLPVLNPQIALTVPKTGYDQFAHLMLNNVMLINKHFNARDVIKNNAMNWLSPFRVGFKSAVLNIIPFLLGYYPGFSNPHLPSPFLKTVYGELWNKEKRFINETMKHRFRSNDDITQYLFYDWQLCTKRFVPTKRMKLGHYYEIQDDMTKNKEILEAIRSQKYPVVCLNDKVETINSQQLNYLSKELINAFEEILPRKSTFEK